jgi:hypothetical protein
VIVVVGNPGPPVHQTGGGSSHDAAVAIARSAAVAGATVQLVARVPDDAVGDRLLLDLAAAGVGHVATLRPPPGVAAPILQAADVDLALRYLADVSVLVLVDVSDPALVRVALDAADWSRGTVIALVPVGGTVPSGLPASAIVLEAPERDPEEAFASVVATLAASLDRGVDPAVALRDALAREPGWTQVTD